MLCRTTCGSYIAGISIAVGTDAGNEGLLHGASMHAELEALADVGFKPSELIVAATRNGAGVVGKQAEVGTIVDGRWADFLVLTEDPLVDILNLAKIETIVHSGHAFRTPACSLVHRALIIEKCHNSGRLTESECKLRQRRVQL
jgi:adenine deaminase